MTRIYITLIALLTITQPVVAQTFSGTLTVESNVDNSDIGTGIYSYSNELSVTTLPDFDFAFSSLGDTDFSVTWQAPTNSLIQITPPSGFDSVLVFFQFYTGSNGYSTGMITPPTTLTHTDFSGNTLPNMPSLAQFTGPQTSAAPADSVLAFIQPNNFAFDDPFYLSSATVEFTVPAAYNVDFNGPVVGFNIQGVAFSNQPNVAPADPGQWITLVQVPEPSSFALLGVAGLGVIARRRRRLR